MPRLGGRWLRDTHQLSSAAWCYATLADPPCRARAPRTPAQLLLRRRLLLRCSSVVTDNPARRAPDRRALRSTAVALPCQDAQQPVRTACCARHRAAARISQQAPLGACHGRQQHAEHSKTWHAAAAADPCRSASNLVLDKTAPTATVPRATPPASPAWARSHRRQTTRLFQYILLHSDPLDSRPRFRAFHNSTMNSSSNRIATH